MGSKRNPGNVSQTKGPGEEGWRLQEEARLHYLSKPNAATKAWYRKPALFLETEAVDEAWFKGIAWLTQAQQALWQVRGVQYIYPGAYIRITDPLTNSLNLGECCYTVAKWGIFRKQYLTDRILQAARESTYSSEGTATWLPTFRSDVPRLSGKGGCLVGISFITSQAKGTHLSFHFRAAEFTWRHSVDMLFITRLCQVVPELPKPITIHLHYDKLFLNTMFLPMLRVSLGRAVHDKLLSLAYPRLYRQWANNSEKWVQPFKEKDIKMKAILRAMKWTRGDILPKHYEWDDLKLE